MSPAVILVVRLTTRGVVVQVEGALEDLQEILRELGPGSVGRFVALLTATGDRPLGLTATRGAFASADATGFAEIVLYWSAGFASLRAVCESGI